MGSADRFTALDEEDLAALVRALGDAQAAGVKVVLAPLSLPGARWAMGTPPVAMGWRGRIGTAG